MELRTHRSDLHVVQQSRRDKLRVQNIHQTPSSSSPYLADYTFHNQGPNMELSQLPSCRYGNVSYEQSVLSSEFLNYAGNPQSQVVIKNDPATVNQNFSDWNVASVVETSYGSLIPNGVPISASSVKPANYFRFHETQSFLSNTLTGENHFEEMQFSGGSMYQNSVHGASAGNETQGMEMTALPLQSVSLSLCSVSPSKSHLGQIGDRVSVSEDLNCNIDGCLPLRSDYSCSSSKQWSKVSENLVHRNVVVPFGPFTGYATILKSSRFLKPAQQLLDELCNVSGQRAITISELTKKVLDEASLSSNAGDSCGLSSTFYSSNEKSRDAGGVSCSNESNPRSEYQQTRVKLLFMQDEICRWYRQYHQQMQMVVSSFKSVAGLSAATPYILLALKNIAKNFYSLNNAISDQLRNIRRTVGEELLSNSGRTKGADRVGPSLKSVDHEIEKQKTIGGGGMGILDPQQHVWRPQRGLPERAVAVLRAWLFDHFLHPYPTDTDKHMLATQTGLTRNQVSNWFINARVRVWKPMVEEIHTLETKAMAEKVSNVGKTEVSGATEAATHQPNHIQHFNGFTHLNESQYSTNRLSMRGIPGMQAECCPDWSHAEEKQPRINNCHQQLPAGMDGAALMGFMPYQRNNLEIGGLGSVSLTLGLRQSAEAVQQQHEPHHQLRQQLGGQMIHDYFG